MKHTVKNFPQQGEIHNLHVHSHEAQRWAEEFEKELREMLAEATKEWDELGLICADLRRDLLREILGEEVEP